MNRAGGAPSLLEGCGAVAIFFVRVLRSLAASTRRKRATASFEIVT